MCGLVHSSYPMCGFSRVIRFAVLLTQVIRFADLAGLSDVRFLPVQKLTLLLPTFLVRVGPPRMV